ncbi:hypothetical protein PENTCL1PPCAC_23635, partial [Pristionchus entomophagus]
PPPASAPSSAVFSLGASAGGGGAAAAGAAGGASGAAFMRELGLPPSPAAPAAATPLTGGFIADFSSNFFLPKHITTGLINRSYDITGVLLGCLRRVDAVCLPPAT